MKTFVCPTPKMFSISRIRLDPNNPRLRLYPGGTTEKAVIERLCKLGGKGSPALVIKHIKTDGGYIHSEAPILYIDPQTKTKIVIDGNRRVAALKMILSPDLVPSTLRGLRADCEKLAELVPSRIQCWYTSSLSDAKRIVYRAHNEGTKEWETLAKYSAYFDYYHRDNLRIDQIAEITGATRASILRSINTWLLIDYLSKNIKDFMIDGAGITSFERVTTSYTDFCKRIGLTTSDDGVYNLPQSDSLSQLLLKIYNNSAKEKGLSREVQNNDKAREEWINKIIPPNYSPHCTSKSDAPHTSHEDDAKNESDSDPKNTEEPDSNSNKRQTTDQNIDATIKQVLSRRRNVGGKAFEIFKEYSNLKPLHDFPVASAALTRAMIETTLKYHAKRLGCYSEPAELQSNKLSEKLDEVANSLKKLIMTKGLPYSSDLVGAITSSTKSVAELNDVMHKDGTFAARPAVRSSLASLASAVKRLLEIQ